MNEKIFHREEYPLETLAKFGLTEEMIYDLPGVVHDILEMGGKSPLLPITVEQPFGQTHAYAKFSLVENEGSIDVLFSPHLKSADLSRFTEEEQRILSEGGVVVTQVFEKAGYGSDEREQRIKAFVQLYMDTNAVVYVPTHIIGNNILTASKYYDLSAEDIETLSGGGIITFDDTDEKGQTVPVSLGVYLLSEKGLFFTVGNADHWKVAVRPTLSHFSFGNDGCWFFENDILSYVKEQDFTPEMQAAIRQRSDEADGTARSNTLTDEMTLSPDTQQEAVPRQLMR